MRCNGSVTNLLKFVSFVLLLNTMLAGCCWQAGQVCPVCRRVWLAGEVDVAQCSRCAKGVHAGCDAYQEHALEVRPRSLCLCGVGEDQGSNVGLFNGAATAATSSQHPLGKTVCCSIRHSASTLAHRPFHPLLLWCPGGEAVQLPRVPLSPGA
jgi:hypothetical protein